MTTKQQEALVLRAAELILENRTLAQRVAELESAAPAARSPAEPN